ncbi:MAG: septum formation protein Maf [Bdellovibrionales bacterium RIFCSPHIGHO2_01_FULL_40_29]|nr:MAG: septum formation protein Maf [Bdellovibrionales bacterium RIFCSPHIGHO2_01_FULL_40_29]OFZ32673.1 MAG: septum formation protein Maf [Bdellovibrionales bacterium RIFCSPHIGHO2_02_FULL_40_15]
MLPTLILASTSKYRAELIQKLGIPFLTKKPNYDEDTAKSEGLLKGFTPERLAEELSRGKARSLEGPNQTVIAGDQLVHLSGKILGKSERFDLALEQLSALRGQWHQLITAVTIKTAQNEFHINHVTHLHMRQLTDQEIENYLRSDAPYDCAGSYKIEKSGLILFDEIKTDDFSAIQGIPLIWVASRLKELGYEYFQK